MTAFPRVRLDIHAHLIPLIEEQLQGVPGVQWAQEGYAIVDGVPMRRAELYQPHKLIAWMDQNGVSESWVSAPPTLYRAQLGAHESLGWATLLNHAMVSMTASHPRLAPMLHLPVYHAPVAIQVAQAAVAAGHRRFAMPAGDAKRGLMLSDASYAPLWTLLDKASAFLLLHPAGACDPRLSRFSLPNLLGGPTETAIAAAHLAMSGTLERHPRLTVCLAHGGGSFAAVAGRLQRGQDTDREGTYLGGEKLRTTLKRMCVDCITHDANALEFVAATFGPDRVLFGSDWPFDMGLVDPHTQLRDVLPALRDRILLDNPDALLRHMGLEQAEVDQP